MDMCAHIDPGSEHGRVRWCECGRYAFVDGPTESFAVRRLNEKGQPLG